MIPKKIIFQMIIPLKIRTRLYTYTWLIITLTSDEFITYQYSSSVV